MKSALRTLFASTLILSAAAASAETPFLAKENTQRAASRAYWTPQRLAGATPYDVTFRPGAVNLNAAPQAAEPGPAASVAGSEPQAGLKARPQVLFDLADLQRFSPLAQLTVEPESVGTGAGHYSSTRVFPVNVERNYPYLPTGKLYFSIGNDDYVCSASVIRKRIIVTAGHCVHEGSGGQSGFHDNFLFVPALRGNVAPYGTWDWNYVVVTGTWTSGDGAVPNGADYAVIETVDRSISGALKKIGDVTGTYGWATGKLNPNHVTILGYPQGFDSGTILHEVNTGFKKAKAPTCAEYGSDMTGGSSGGPWVQNFGYLATGQSDSAGTSRNQVVGITSYGYTNAGIKLQGSSIPDSRFTSIINTACAHKSGNC
jgi:V8-like Glu-specific endopeptidase